jgi:hypothetical protein
MLASLLLQYTPLRAHPAAERRALGVVVGEQLRAYRAGLSLLAPAAAGATAKDIPLNYKVWGMQYGSQATQVLRSYDAIADLFQQNGIDGRLLILGEPGMGKTHTLLAVGERLRQRAGHSHGPLPVWVDLSAWAGENLDQWLIGYLWEEYRICQPTARDWLNTAQFTLLLDGFDHLPTDRQRACAKELDTLLRSNANQTAILCCRRRVLESSGINFSYFNSGVHIVPLAAQQVKDYAIAQNHPDLWARIKASKALQQLARFPLYLTMLVLLAPSLQGESEPITGRTSLIQRYLDYHLSLSATTQAQDLTVLKGLAHSLESRSRWFRLDRLQRTWLPSSQRLLYRGLVGLAIVLIFTLVGGSPGLGLALGLVFSQLDLETFPYTRLSLATASWRGIGTLALASGLPALVVGLLFGGLAALLLGRFNLGLPAFGWAGLVGAVLGWGLGLGAVLWGGLPQVIQIRQGSHQDILLGLRNTLLLFGLLGGIFALVLVLPAVVNGQPPLTLLSIARLRVLAASLISAMLWLSFALQYTVVRGLLAVAQGHYLPLGCQSVLNRFVNQRLLRQGCGSYWFGHEEVREGMGGKV